MWCIRCTVRPLYRVTSKKEKNFASKELFFLFRLSKVLGAVTKDECNCVSWLKQRTNDWVSGLGYVPACFSKLLHEFPPSPFSSEGG
jgi:hypothetical protein